jgi:two-component system sensor histidine kinase/response regulator
MLFDALTRMLLVRDHSTAAGVARATPQHGLQDLTGVRVLLTEDNPLNQQVACELLAEVGVVVKVAGNGRIAVEMAQAEAFDAILMDMQMPEMDGLDATRTLQALPDWNNTPIIAMTANAMTADRRSCLEAGMVDFVAKPIEPHKLFSTLLRWTRKSAAQNNADADTSVPTWTRASASLSMLPPSIDGLDVDAGMRRVLGRPDRYLALLKNFVTEQGDAVPRIRLALDQGKKKEALRAAHTLKGLAGTIGAHALHDAAYMLESAIEEDTAEQQLPDVSLVLHALLQELRRVFAETAATQEVLPPPNVSTALGQEMEQLLKLLRNDDAQAQRFFADHDAWFEKHLGPHRYLRVKSLLESMVLDEALESLTAAPST